MIKALRCSPAAVARQLITQLESHKKLSAIEQRVILDALRNSGVPNATDRLIASLSRDTLTEILKSI